MKMSIRLSKEQVVALAALVVSVMILMSSSGAAGSWGDSRAAAAVQREVVFPRLSEVQFANPDRSVYEKGGREIFAPQRATRLPIPSIDLPDPRIEPIALPPFRPSPLKPIGDYLRADPKKDVVPAANLDESKTEALKNLQEPVIERRPDLRDKKMPGKEDDVLIRKAGGPEIHGTLVSDNTTAGGVYIFKDLQGRQNPYSANDYDLVRSQTYLQYYNSFKVKTLDERLNLARQVFNWGMTLEAKRELETVCRQAPDKLDAIKMLAQLYSEDHEFDKAVELFTRMLQSVRSDKSDVVSTIHYLLGLVWRDYGLAEKALEEFDLAYPGVIASGIEKGRLHLRLGRYDLAKKDADSVLSLASSSMGAQGAECFVIRATAALRLGDLAAAREDVKRALTNNPSCAEALNLRGVLAAFEKKFDAAANDFVEAIKQNQYLTDAWINLAILFLGARKATKAEELLQWAIQRDPTVADLYALQGVAHQLLENLDMAEESFKRSLATERDNLYGSYALAWVLLSKKQDSEGLKNPVAEALNLINRAIQKDYYFTPLYYTGGVAYSKAGQLAPAEVLLRDVPETSESFVDACAAIAIICLRQSRVRQAVEALARAREKREFSTDALLSFLEGYAWVVRSDEAVEKRLKRAAESFQTSTQLGNKASKEAWTAVNEWLVTFVRLDEKFNRENGPTMPGGWQKWDSPKFPVEIVDRKVRFSSNVTRSETPEDRPMYTSLRHDIPSEEFYSLEATLYPNPKKTGKAIFGLALLSTASGTNTPIGPAFVLRYDATEQKIVPCCAAQIDEENLRQNSGFNLERLQLSVNQQEVRVRFVRRTQDQTASIDIAVWNDTKKEWIVVKPQVPLQSGRQTAKMYKVVIFCRCFMDTEYEFFVDDVRVLEHRSE